MAYTRIDYPEEIKKLELLTKEKERVKAQHINEKKYEQLFSETTSRFLKPVTEKLEDDGRQLQALVHNSNQLLDEQRNIGNMLEENNERYLQYYGPDTSIEDLFTPEKPKPKIYDVDKSLTEEDIDNLKQLNFDLPSVVANKRGLSSEHFEQIYKKISSENRSIGQRLSKANKDKQSPNQIEMYKSMTATLGKYKQALKLIESSLDIKVGEGCSTVFYKNADDLAIKLEKLVAAKEAGNTGVDNAIISILDELLHKGFITKSIYDELY